MNIDTKELHKLFKKIKYNDKNAFSELYKKCNKLAYGVAFSILKNKEYSEDVVQNVFEKIYSLDKEKLPTESEASWIYTVTKNEALKILKEKNKTIDLDNIYEISDDDNEISKIIDKNDFNKLIDKLDDKEKEIIALKVLSNFSFKEISQLVKEPIGTVKWRYYKSIKTLKLMLSNLAISIVTFIIGIKTGLKKTEQIIIEDEESDSKIENTEHGNTEKVEEDNIQEDTSVAIDKTNNFTNQIQNEIASDSRLESVISNTEISENIILDSERENKPLTQSNDISTIMFGTSFIFLILSIIFFIFFIKHQPKRSKKASK